MKCRIRQETSGDTSAVFEVVRSAFEHALPSDHDEHHLVERLRKSSAFVPELSLVAESDGRVAGHILFTEIRIADTTQLALAPLSVVPSLQRMGIGGQLIREGHRIARDMGYTFSVVLGHPDYYPRFGYRPASAFGIRAPFEVPDEVYMALNLQGTDGKLDGVAIYPPEFGIN